MDWICWELPLKPGTTDAARSYCSALETERRAEYEASQRKLGIDREIFFLWHGPDDTDYVVLYMDGPDMKKSLDLWEKASTDFEMWGKAEWRKFSDEKDYPVPLSAGPGNGPVLEVLSAYDANIHSSGQA
jgi:hypothetical protein